jgi:RNA polymerase sigma-70 factor (ECF subfamily)
MALAQADESSAQPLKAETIAELFGALESPLLTYALRLVHDRGAAEEIVQDAFMKLHASLEEIIQPRRWLYRTVHNMALNHQRHAGRTISLEPGNDGEPHVLAELVDPQPLPDEQIARCEGIGLVRLSLEALDERSRELIRLKFVEGLSYQEMSTRLGLTVGHVGYLLHHTLKAIAAELSKTGGLL